MTDPTTATTARNYWEHTVRDDATALDEGALRGPVSADVVVVGAGFTGLWAAIHLSELDPSSRIVIIEQAEVGHGASGRNGGFCSGDVTHGFANSLKHFPKEARELHDIGRDNLRRIVDFIRENNIDCDLQVEGTTQLATSEFEAKELRDFSRQLADYGVAHTVAEPDDLNEVIRSSRWRAGITQGTEAAVMLNPLKLARGLARVARSRGVQIFRDTPALALRETADGVQIDTPVGHVDARQVIVATSAYSGWLPSLRKWFVPVYDYLMVSEPVDPKRLDAVGWRSLGGFIEASNQFHYFRRLPDNRLLWGGYDAVYYKGKVGSRFDHRPEIFEGLRARFADTFPELADVDFPFQWGGAIDTTTRFTVTFGHLPRRRGVFVLGYTGHGVGATHWAAEIAARSLVDPGNEQLKLRMVRSRPIPFPPEPLRSIGIRVMQHELAKADRRGGRRGPILKLLDAMKIGFDS